MEMMIGRWGKSRGGRPVPLLIDSGKEQESPEMTETPDLQTQLEDLISCVRYCESWARQEDRIDLAVRLLKDKQ